MGVAIRLPLFKSRGRDEEGPSREKKARTTARRSEQGGQGAKNKKRAQQHKTRAASAKGATRKVQAAAAEKKRASFGWLNRILVLLGVGVVLVAALEAWIFLSSIPVERISVTGELEHTRTSAVQELVYPALSGGFLGADLGDVRRKLEALPWIYEANVRRVWPNALEINVVEQLPIARWGSAAFLNHEGQVFSPSRSDAWASLPLLTGPEGAAGSLMRTYQRLVDLLTPLGLGVKALTVDERGQVEAELAGGQRLIIGGDNFLQRMQRFTRLYKLELASRMEEVERVDLRYQQGVAVAYRELPVEDEQQDKSKKV